MEKEENLVKLIMLERLCVSQCFLGVSYTKSTNHALITQLLSSLQQMGLSGHLNA